MRADLRFLHIFYVEGVSKSGAKEMQSHSVANSLNRSSSKFA